MAFESFELMATIIMMMIREDTTMWHEQSTAWDFDGELGFDQLEKWSEYTPEGVTKNKDKKLLWDFSIRTDHEIETRRPDLVVINKNKSCQK